MEFVDKTSIADLLTDGGRVAGAIGFSLLDGSCLVVQAKSVIIATGGQSYRLFGMWSCQRGDGLGMAWRAGAEMRNAEWGPFLQLAGKKGKEPVIGAEDALYNAWGEKLSKTFRRRRQARRVRRGRRHVVPGDAGRQRAAAELPPRELDAAQHLRRRGGRYGVGPPARREILAHADRQGHQRRCAGPLPRGVPGGARRALADQGRSPDGEHGAGALRLRQLLLQRLQPAGRRAGLAGPHARRRALRRHLDGHPRRGGGGRLRRRRRRAAGRCGAGRGAARRDACAAGAQRRRPAMDLVHAVQEAINPSATPSTRARSA